MKPPNSPTGPGPYSGLGPVPCLFHPWISSRVCCYCRRTRYPVLVHAPLMNARVHVPLVPAHTDRMTHEGLSVCLSIYLACFLLVVAVLYSRAQLSRAKHINIPQSALLPPPPSLPHHITSQRMESPRLAFASIMIASFLVKKSFLYLPLLTSSRRHRP
ncbi:hypothetical protein J3E69DRAFT_326879 [Trichoderma sp. SZMC 28015]